jgi:hypothetical protein
MSVCKMREYPRAPGEVWVTVPNPVTLNAPLAFLPNAVAVIVGNPVTIPLPLVAYELKFSVAL